MSSAPVPRLTGLALRAVARALASDTIGPPLRRALGGMVVEQKLAGLDFAAEGEPAPLYCPAPYRPVPYRSIGSTENRDSKEEAEAGR